VGEGDEGDEVRTGVTLEGLVLPLLGEDGMPGGSVARIIRPEAQIAVGLLAA